MHIGGNKNKCFACSIPCLFDGQIFGAPPNFVIVVVVNDDDDVLWSDQPFFSIFAGRSMVHFISGG